MVGMLESIGEVKKTGCVSEDYQELILTRLVSRVVEIELVSECLVDGKVKCLILAPNRKSRTRLAKKTFRLGYLTI